MYTENDVLQQVYGILQQVYGILQQVYGILQQVYGILQQVKVTHFHQSDLKNHNKTNFLKKY